MTADAHDHARQRRTTEPSDRDDPGGAFTRDRLRLLSSPALRRLSAVTQVNDPDDGPVPHNRLTHSLDVAAIGATIATAIGADPVVVETACLAHDLGHPPFGHNGETTLRTRARRHGLGFEANAQTLRILTRLATTPGTTSADGGLNLTRASLDATCKYPWTPEAGNRKYGAYPEDAATLAWIRDTSPDGVLCLEAQIMDVADDIANAVHDLTAGLRAEMITLAPLRDHTDRAAFAKLAAGHFTTLTAGEIDHHATELVQQPAITHLADTETHGTPDAAATTLAYELTTRFVTAIVCSTRAAAGPGPHCKYAAGLEVPSSIRAEIALLKALHLHFVLRAPEVRAHRGRQREVLEALLDAMLQGAPRGLDPGFACMWAKATTDRDRVRVVFDQVATCTDRRAVELWAQLTRRQSSTVPVTVGRPRVW